jgi:hypothetical protein
VYPCAYAVNEQWSYTPGANGALGRIQSTFADAGSPCLVTDGVPAQPGYFMVDEFGDGALTFFGAYVTDYCVASC